MTPSPTPVDALDALTRLESLVSASGGLFSSVRRISLPPDIADYNTSVASVGDIWTGYGPRADEQFLPDPGARRLDGSGTDLDPAMARLYSLGEGLERYCSSTYRTEQFRWATADELAAAGEPAVDLDRCPRLSDVELSDPRCPIVRPDKGLPQRWVRGIDLHTGEPAWVPAVLVYLGLPPQSRGEAWWMPISTGCAVHTDPYRALTGALLEAVERDALTLLWLQKLPVPRLDLDLDACPPHLRDIVERHAASGSELHLFDATTDLGIPAVYALDRAPHPRLENTVNCVTGFDPHTIIAKIFRETSSCRSALTSRRPVRTDVDTFHGLFDGALHTGHPDRRHAFDFLTDVTRSVPLASLPTLRFDSAEQEYRHVVRALADRGMPAYAVDLSTDEAVRSGLTAVRVVVPDLLPLTFSPKAQFRAHPRLYSAPVAMGMRALAEEELNSHPQPMA